MRISLYSAMQKWKICNANPSPTDVSPNICCWTMFVSWCVPWQNIPASLADEFGRWEKIRPPILFITYIHTFIQSHSYHTFIHRHSRGPLSISSSLESSGGRPSRWCRAENRTRACYIKPTRYQLSHAAPNTKFEFLKAFGLMKILSVSTCLGKV